MDFKEVIPNRALRKFDAMCLHNHKLHQDMELQQQMLNWAADMLTEAREEWGKLHTTTIEAVVLEDRKAQAKNAVKPEMTNMHLLENILSKSREKSLMKH